MSNEKEINQILDKMSEKGFESLSDYEKHVLKNPEKITFADIKPEAMLGCCTTDYLLRWIFMQVFWQ
jgi:hypothetical protein